MKIMVVSDWFSESMGYAENCLPREFAELGSEVHLVASTAQIYFNSPDYDRIYRQFLGPREVPVGSKYHDGYRLTRLPLMRVAGRLGIRGLTRLILAERPDVVQVFDHSSLSAVQAAAPAAYLRSPLFTASHIHSSVFPGLRGARRLQATFTTYLPGRAVSVVAEACYAISRDSAQIATTYLGVPASKIRLSPLGVDTKTFHPPISAEDRDARHAFRRSLGFRPDDLVCLYTGRLTASKDPLRLALAVAELHSQGKSRFRGLFVGAGPLQKHISDTPGCVTHPFVPHSELPAIYQAADVAVWPRQESTSMLDAAASGLPVIVSNRAEVRDRIEGNGLVFREGSQEDLARTIAILDDEETRRRLGEHGRRKMMKRFSWTRIARERLRDYERARDPRDR